MVTDWFVPVVRERLLWLNEMPDTPSPWHRDGEVGGTAGPTSKSVISWRFPSDSPVIVTCVPFTATEAMTEFVFSSI